MNWAEIGTEILLSIIGVVVSGLGVFITYLINKYIKNDQLKTYLNSLNDIVKACTQEVYQTYVDALKKNNAFDKEAQEEALQLCLEKINETLPKELKNWLNNYQVDVNKYLISLIESNVYMLKVGVK